jgi:TDG/mug DNA glycosylase family protein
VFCGVNPGNGSARAGRPFANPSNRFWEVLHRAGFTPYRVRSEEAHLLLLHGCGLTALVPRPTRSVAELTRQELRDAAPALEKKLEHYKPEVIAFLGKAAYAALSGVTEVSWGRQEERWVGAIVWILPNPSGRNRRFTIDALVASYGELQRELAVRSA